LGEGWASAGRCARGGRRRRRPPRWSGEGVPKGRSHRHTPPLSLSSHLPTASPPLPLPPPPAPSARRLHRPPRPRRPAPPARGAPGGDSRARMGSRTHSATLPARGSGHRSRSRRARWGAWISWWGGRAGARGLTRRAGVGVTPLCARRGPPSAAPPPNSPAMAPDAVKGALGSRGRGWAGAARWRGRRIRRPLAPSRPPPNPPPPPPNPSHFLLQRYHAHRARRVPNAVGIPAPAHAGDVGEDRVRGGRLWRVRSPRAPPRGG